MLDKGRASGLPLVPYLRNVNVRWGHVDTEDVLQMELADDERERFEVLKGDLLVCEGGEVGRAAVWPGGASYMSYQKALHRLRPHPGVSGRFLRYLLEDLANDGTLKRYSTGSTIAHLPQQALRSVPIDLPPFVEQQRIVDVLEEHLSCLDSAARSLGKSNRRVSAMLSQWIHEQLAGTSSASVALGELIKDSRTGWDRGLTFRTSGDEGFKYIKMNNITMEGDLDLNVISVRGTEEEANRYRVRGGDILFNNRNSPELVGKSALVSSAADGWTYNNNLVRLRFGNAIDPAFMAMQMNSREFRERLRATTKATTSVAAIYTRNLVQIPVRLPEPGIQSALAGQYQELRTSAARVRREIRSSLGRGAALRRALLSAAFSGQLRGRSSDTDVIEGFKEEESA